MQIIYTQFFHFTFSALATIAATSSAMETSPPTATPCPFNSCIASTVRAAAARFRSAATTEAPSCANKSAACRPIPLPAPVSSQASINTSALNHTQKGQKEKNVLCTPSLNATKTLMIPSLVPIRLQIHTGAAGQGGWDTTSQTTWRGMTWLDLPVIGAVLSTSTLGRG